MSDKNLNLPYIYYGFHYLTLFLKTNFMEYFNKSKLYYCKENQNKKISAFVLHFLNFTIGDMKSCAGYVLLSGQDYMNYILKFMDNYKKYRYNSDIRWELIQDYYNKIALETLNIVSNDVMTRIKRLY